MLGSLAADTPHVTAAVPAPAVTVSAGGCSASPLPLDATCAAVARRLFRAAAAGVGLPAESVYDGATMASELAANSMHAQTGIQFDARGCAVAGAPEIWLYLRRSAGRRNWSARSSTPCRAGKTTRRPIRPSLSQWTR